MLSLKLYYEWYIVKTLKYLLTRLEGSGNVPGDIYTDLHRSGLIEQPLYGDNDVKLKWIARQNWAYSKTFWLNDAFMDVGSCLMTYYCYSFLSMLRNRKFATIFFLQKPSREYYPRCSFDLVTLFDCTDRMNIECYSLYVISI